MTTATELIVAIESIQFDLLASGSTKTLDVQAFTSSPYAQSTANLVMSGKLTEAIRLLTQNGVIR